MSSFRGHTVPPEFAAQLQAQGLGGVTLFRALNIENPAQVRALNQELQTITAQAGLPPLLIGADQEGGQLQAIGNGPTEFPGNLALGATGSPELAYQVGYALGRELAAMGFNLNYAPVCDVNINPHNPVISTRSFGEDPALVGALSAAQTSGLQAAGVIASAKHFPGHGDTNADSHHGPASVTHTAERLRAVELLPFRAAIQAGVKIIMTAHLALPALNQGSDLPSTLSPAILRGLLRDEMGFTGVVMSDALDMRAITQGAGLVLDTLAAANAGCDMLMLTTFLDQNGLYEALCQAEHNGVLSAVEHAASLQRIAALKQWLGSQQQPELSVVGCAEHQTLAQEVSRRAVTLVRNERGLLPLRLDSAARLAVITATPTNLTPADTSAFVEPTLADAIRKYHPTAEGWTMPFNPSAAEVAELVQRATAYDLVIIGTLNANTALGQAEVVNALLSSSVPTLPIALRMPYDLLAYPTAPAYVCAYSVQAPMMQALAAALWGETPFVGKLPVRIPDLYPVGHHV